MRTAFIETLFALARDDERIVLIVGDLGFGVVNRFMQELPQQFVNAGVAEQNMSGLATGMAMNGRIVFTYSIGNFPVVRCLEQVRNDICYHKANVKIVTVGGGMAYGSLGITHHATEDLAIMRALPNLTIIAPGDPIEAGLATRAIVKHSGPCYLRLGRNGEPKMHEPSMAFRLGRAITVRDGHDLTLISAGGGLYDVVKAADVLTDEGLHARVLSMHTIKPLDIEAVLKAASETPAIFTVEEHSVIGGLGSAVAEVLMESGHHQVRFKRIGVDGTFTSKVGDQAYLRAHYGLDVQGILRTVKAVLAPQFRRKGEYIR